MLTFDKNFGRLNNLVHLWSRKKTGLHSRSSKSNYSLSTFNPRRLSKKFNGMEIAFSRQGAINTIPLVGTSNTGRRTKFELGESVAHKGKSVDEVLLLSINEYLGNISFNDTSDITRTLTAISVEVTNDIRNLFPQLSTMIERRHHIVHRADRIETVYGRGNHRIQTISLNQVREWISVIDSFVTEVNKNFN